MALPAYWDFNEFDPLRIQATLRGMTLEEQRAHLAEQSVDIKRSVEVGSRYFLIIDARTGMRAPPEIRKLQAEWLAEHSEYLAQSCLGIAFVIKERVVRGALTAIFWVTKSPVPYTVHANLAEAIEHGKGVCQDAGLSLPPAAADDPVQLYEEALAVMLREHGAAAPTG